MDTSRKFKTEHLNKNGLEYINWVKNIWDVVQVWLKSDEDIDLMCFLSRIKITDKGGRKKNGEKVS